MESVKVYNEKRTPLKSVITYCGQTNGVQSNKRKRGEDTVSDDISKSIDVYVPFGLDPTLERKMEWDGLSTAFHEKLRESKRKLEEDFVPLNSDDNHFRTPSLNLLHKNGQSKDRKRKALIFEDTTVRQIKKPLVIQYIHKTRTFGIDCVLMVRSAGRENLNNKNKQKIIKTSKMKKGIPEDRLRRMIRAVQQWNAYFGTFYTLF